MATQWNPMEKACTSKTSNNNRKKTKYNRDPVASLTPLTPHISVRNTHET